MIPELRRAYNRAFDPFTYRHFLDWMEAQYDHRPLFKIAETPVFIPSDLTRQLVEACEEITDVIVRPDFGELSQSALLAGQQVPGETPHTTFLQMDFGICRDESGELQPRLIEVQGFPSLYFFQDLLAEGYRKHFQIPGRFSHLFGELDSESYMDKLRQIIVGDHLPENVVLLEVEPRKQVTEIDFIIARERLGIPYLCVSEIKKEGKHLYYTNEEGRRVAIYRIFNRVIFDELIQRDDLKREFYFTEEAAVEWVGHPNWFFRISKHTLPLLRHSRYVPDSQLLSEIDRIPEDLENYVLKPLYSFAGTGVIINLHRYDLEGIDRPENYILQRKVDYAPVVDTPDGPAKCEIRMLMLWEKGAPRPQLVNNLARLSKGEMIGVRYNKGKSWVGGSVGFFPKEFS